MKTSLLLTFARYCKCQVFAHELSIISNVVSRLTIPAMHLLIMINLTADVNCTSSLPNRSNSLVLSFIFLDGNFLQWIIPSGHCQVLRLSLLLSSLHWKCHTHLPTFDLQSLGESNTLKSNANIISGQNTAGTPSSVGVVSVGGVGGASLGGNNSGSNSITGNTGLSSGNVASGNNTTVSATNTEL